MKTSASTHTRKLLVLSTLVNAEITTGFCKILVMFDLYANRCCCICHELLSIAFVVEERKQ